VCIPTLNRANLIGETLESIVSQITDEVEVVIVDGGSSTDTEDVVAQFQKRTQSIRYFRVSNIDSLTTNAPSNSGFDRDCSRAVDLAVGQYCWLFTDDDLLKPGAIQAVLEAIEHQYSAVIVNAEVRSGDLSRCLQSARLNLIADRIYTPIEGDRLLADVGSYLSFMGGLVIKKELWNAREKEPYIGLGFIHAAVLFQRPITQDVLVIAESFITIRYGDALYMRSSRYFEIWMFCWPKLVWSFSHFSDSAKRQVAQKEPWRRKRTLFLFRAIGAFSKKQYQEFLEKRIESPWNRAITRLVASCPGFCANLIAILYYHLSGRMADLTLVDLMKSPFYFGRASSTASSSRKPQEGKLTANAKILS
jgi:abequosyltransferase